MAPKKKAAKAPAQAKARGRPRRDANAAEGAPEAGAAPEAAPANAHAIVVELNDEDEAAKRNSQIIAKMVANLEVIKNHPTFAGIETMDPAVISDNAESGTQMPFTKAHFENAIKHRSSYKCGDNFFRCDHTKTASRGVPMVEANIESLISHHFLEPAPLPLNMVIPVKTDEDPTQRRGVHLCVTPQELRIAFINAIARDISNEVEDETLAEWRAHALSCPFEYRLLDSDEDVIRAARQIREDVSQQHVTLRLSAVQQIFEVIHFKKRKEQTLGKMTAKQVATLYSENMRFADTTEQITESFIDMALTVNSRLLEIPTVCDIVLKAESQFGVNTPFNGITKLQTIVSKAPRGMAWHGNALACHMA